MGILIDHYEVIEKIGSGAMGEVFKARDPRSNKFVAIKILKPELCDNPRAKKRFKREITQTIRLKHPNLIEAYSAGEYRGRLYYAMEYIEGTTVKKQLLTRGCYDESRALEILIQVSEALEYTSSSRGDKSEVIIHRDIKPDNIMITYDGKAKLCDMGLAKSTEGGVEVTIEGTVLGTPHYMSPEQALGNDLDIRTDIFSLGSTFYHMLSGSPPFEGVNAVFIMEMLQKSEPVPIQERNPKISDETCGIITKMMKKKREDRYQNFSELLRDLKDRTQGKSISVPKPPPKQVIKFKECFPPLHSDILLGQIAIHNKVLIPQKMEECLNRQEFLRLMGVEVDLSDVLFEQKIVNLQQRSLLHKARGQFLLDRGDELFFKVCNNNSFLSPQQLEECKRMQKSGVKGICGIWLARGKIDEEKRQKVYSSIRHMISAEEGNSLLKASIENKLITQQQAEKCSRIYNNNIVMGKYRPIGDILVERSFLSQEALDVVVRGLRRSLLTGKPVAQYIDEKKLS